MGALLVGSPLVVVSAGPVSADDTCQPAAQPCVVVRTHGGAEQTIPVDPTSVGDVTSAQYRTYSGHGGIRDDPYVQTGASVPGIITKAGLDPGSVTRVTASAGPSQTQLDVADLDPGSYQNGLVPVFFSDSPQFIRFARPMRYSTDVNVRDIWSGSAGASVYLDVYTSGRVLHPVIKASTTTTKAGTAVRFSAGFVGYQPNGPSYSWNFGDGGSSAAAAPAHAWRKGGSSFTVSLTVRAASDAAGVAEPVTVRVGAAPKPKPTPKPKPGTGSGGQNNPSTGPATGDGHAAGGAGTPAPGSSSTGSPAPTSGPTPSPTPKPQPRSPVAAGERVEGVLLVNAAATPSQSLPRQSVREAASARAVPRLTWDRQLLWLLVLPALLLVGVASQTRWLNRRLPVPRWRST